MSEFNKETTQISKETGIKPTEVDANTEPAIKKQSKPAAAKSRAKSNKAHSPARESDAANPTVASLEAIKDRLSDDALRNDFVDNVADLICSYSRRKMDEDEKQSFRNLVDNKLLGEVFKVKKLVK
jgi:hypothetical protein